MKITFMMMISFMMRIPPNFLLMIMTITFMIMEKDYDDDEEEEDILRDSNHMFIVQAHLYPPVCHSGSPYQ